MRLFRPHPLLRFPGDVRCQSPARQTRGGKSAVSRRRRPRRPGSRRGPTVRRRIVGCSAIGVRQVRVRYSGSGPRTAHSRPNRAPSSCFTATCAATIYSQSPPRRTPVRTSDPPDPGSALGGRSAKSHSRRTSSIHPRPCPALVLDVPRALGAPKSELWSRHHIFPPSRAPR